jgi:hypothetical protein
MCGFLLISLLLFATFPGGCDLTLGPIEPVEAFSVSTSTGSTPKNFFSVRIAVSKTNKVI